MKKLVVITIPIILIALLFIWKQNRSGSPGPTTRSNTNKPDRQNNNQQDSNKTKAEITQNNGDETSNITASNQEDGSENKSVTKTVIISGLVKKFSGEPVENGQIRIYITTALKEGERERGLSASYIQTGPLGKFSSEIEYNALPEEECLLTIQLNPYISYARTRFSSGMSGLTKTYTGWSNEERYKNLLYAKPVVFVLKKVEEYVNATIECHQTSTLIVEISPYEKQKYPRCKLEVTNKGWEKYQEQHFAMLNQTTTFAVPSGVNLQLTTTSRGYPDSIVTIEPLSSGVNKHINITMVRTQINLQGRCEDINGRPIEGATVNASQEGMSNIYTKTESDGTFTLENILEKSLKELRFYHRDYNFKQLKDVDINQQLVVILEERDNNQRFRTGKGNEDSAIDFD